VRVLLVKMSSLGDVVHTFPAVTEAAAQGVRFDWVVEEAFADIAAMHPGVDAVIPIAWRRWRNHLWSREVRYEFGEFVGRLRRRHYDMVLDAQGLIKSGTVTALARGARKCGFSAQSAREGAAAMFYPQRVVVPRQQHAVDRLRQLFAGALGYRLDQSLVGPVDFGLVMDVPAQPVCVLLHGTTWSSKMWPESMWVDLGRRAIAHGLQVAVPWGDAAEHARAQRIAGSIGGRVVDRASLGATAQRLASASLVVGVDSGLSHLSAALGVPTVVLFGSTDPLLTGARGVRTLNMQPDFGCVPCRARTCGYGGATQLWRGEAVSPACYSRLAPDQVWRAASELMNADRVLSI
jgi:heptosyltransferase-1